MSNYVFLIDANKTPMNPIEPAQAKKLLNAGKAAVFRRYPFVLIMKRVVENIVTYPITLKIDPGSKFTGIALLNNWELPTLINLISRRLIVALALFLGTGLLVVFTNIESSDGFTIIPEYVYSDLRISLPSSSPKPHPLPPTLAQWQDNTNSGDYFSQVKTTQVGYLVWSQFPVRVYVESPKAISEKQAQAWVNGVLQGVQEWSTYLPLTIVEQPEIADITIARKAPPLQISSGSNIPRARSAQTTYELYTSNKVLSHRFTILLSPSQTGEYLIAATRHEFGHALGIWGHSPLQTDALYFSQVRNPPPISPRDVNTLKRVYEQPTTLGWSLVDNSKIN